MGVAVGVHLLLDVYEVAPERLLDSERWSQALVEAARAAGMTPLSEPIVHRFPGGGWTALLPLAESHLAVHTYPERRYLAADCFTCGDPEGADHAVAVLLEALGPCRIERRRFLRGAGR